MAFERHASRDRENIIGLWTAFRSIPSFHCERNETIRYDTVAKQGQEAASPTRLEFNYAIERSPIALLVDNARRVHQCL